MFAFLSSLWFPAYCHLPTYFPFLLYVRTFVRLPGHQLDRRAAERDRIREERQLEEQRQLEEARRGRGSFGGGGGGGGVISPQEKERDDPYAAAPPSYRSSSRAEEKESVSARDRVIMRRQEKQARDEQDRLEALREAEVDARVHRAAAAVQKRAQYDNSSVLPSAGPSHRGSFAHDAKDGYDEDSVSARWVARGSYDGRRDIVVKIVCVNFD